MTTYDRSAIAEILLVFIVPILLLYLGIIPIRYRFLVLTTFSLVVAFLALVEQRTLAGLGIRKDNLKESLAPYAIFTFVAAMGIIFIAYLTGKSILAHWWVYPHFLFLFIPISFFQEFAYRAFLFPKLITLFR